MGSVVWMAACQVSSFTPLEDSGPTTDVHGSGLEPDSGERDTGERVVEEVKDEVDAVVDEETPGVVSGFRSQLAAHRVEPGLTTDSRSQPATHRVEQGLTTDSRSQPATHHGEPGLATAP